MADVPSPNDTVWCSDEAEAYVEAVIVNVAGAQADVMLRASNRIVACDLRPSLTAGPARTRRGRLEEPPRTLLPRFHGGPVGGLENMDDLLMLNEAEVLHNVATRFRMDNIYTRVGPILIACNPFKFLPIYGEDAIQQYHEARTGSGPLLPPHCYAEAEAALRTLRRTGRPQAIVICGESGAGKTETTKLMLQYLSCVARPANAAVPASAATIGDRMVEATPLMEAFGNAKTARNNNSSRFGKFTAYIFDDPARTHAAAAAGASGSGGGDGGTAARSECERLHNVSSATARSAGAAIRGGSVTNFLLEKSRVVRQPPGERNFHVFYQLCAGAEPALFAALALRAAPTFRYLGRSGCVEVEGMDDAEELETTREALDAAGLAPDEQGALFRVVAGILHLGDVDLIALAGDGDGSGSSGGGGGDGAADREEDGGGGGGDARGEAGDASAVAEGPALGLASRLLGLDMEVLAAALVKRVRELPNGTTVATPLSAAEAGDARDALAKAIYSRLFDDLVRRANAVFDVGANNGGGSGKGGDGDDCFLGILDIFGFEDLEENGFEQLFINFTNERLQHLFNDLVFKQEEQEYRQEDIVWQSSAFPDNQACIDLLGKRPLGLLPFMDSECVRGAAGSDASLAAKFHRAHRGHSHYAAGGLDTGWRRGDGAATDGLDFVVRHFAGPVVYRCQEFLGKNRDALLYHVEAIAAASTHPLVASLFSGGRSGASVSVSASATAATAQVGGGQRLAGQTVAARFLEQLRDLMEQLGRCDARFVRCIKTNEVMAPSLFDKPAVLRQLQSGGVIAALDVRRAGFPARMPYDVFVRSFRVFGASGGRAAFAAAGAFGGALPTAVAAGSAAAVATDDARMVAVRYMANPVVADVVGAEQYRFGKTKLFMQADVLARLERIRNRMLTPMVRRIQRWWCGLQVSQLDRRLRGVCRRLQEIRSRARLARVHMQGRVAAAHDAAAAAARYAEGLAAAAIEGGGGDGGMRPDALKAPLDLLAEAVEAYSTAVDSAAALKRREAEERAELLAALDTGHARLQLVKANAAALGRHGTRRGSAAGLASAGVMGPAGGGSGGAGIGLGISMGVGCGSRLAAATLRAEKGVDGCRAELLRFQQAEILLAARQSSDASQAGGPSAMRRALHRAEGNVATSGDTDFAADAARCRNSRGGSFYGGGGNAGGHLSHSRASYGGFGGGGGSGGAGGGHSRTALRSGGVFGSTGSGVIGVSFSRTSSFLSGMGLGTGLGLGFGDDSSAATAAAAVDWERLDLAARRERVLQVIALVDEAEGMCMAVMAEQQLLDEARAAATRRLQADSARLDDALARADAAGVMVRPEVMDAAVRARAAMRLAEAAVSGTTAYSMADAADRAATLVTDAETTVASAAVAHAEEMRREDCRAALAVAGAAIMELAAAAHALGGNCGGGGSGGGSGSGRRSGTGSDGQAALWEALSAARGALASAEAAGSGSPVEEAQQEAAAAMAAVQRLREAYALEFARTEALRRVREADKARLAPAITQLAVLQAGGVGTAAAGPAAGGRAAAAAAAAVVRNDACAAAALASAEAAVAAAQSAIGATGEEGAPSTRPLIGEAIAAVRRYEREVAAAHARHAVAQERAAEARAALAALRRRLGAAEEAAAQADAASDGSSGGNGIDALSRPELAAADEMVAAADAALGAPRRASEAGGYDCVNGGDVDSRVDEALEAATIAVVAAEKRVAAAASAVSCVLQSRADGRERLQALMAALAETRDLASPTGGRFGKNSGGGGGGGSDAVAEAAADAVARAEVYLRAPLTRAWLDSAAGRVGRDDAFEAALLAAEAAVATAAVAAAARARRVTEAARLRRALMQRLAVQRVQLEALEARGVAAARFAAGDVLPLLKEARAAVAAAATAVEDGLGASAATAAAGDAETAVAATAAEAAIAASAAALNALATVTAEAEARADTENRCRAALEAELDATLTRLQAIEAVVDASGAAVAGSCAAEMAAAHDAVLRAGRLFREKGAGGATGELAAAAASAQAAVAAAAAYADHRCEAASAAAATAAAAATTLDAAADALSALGARLEGQGLGQGGAAAVDAAAAALAAARKKVTAFATAGPLAEGAGMLGDARVATARAVEAVAAAGAATSARAAERRREVEAGTAAARALDVLSSRHGAAVALALQHGVADDAMVAASCAQVEADLAAVCRVMAPFADGGGSRSAAVRPWVADLESLVLREEEAVVAARRTAEAAIQQRHQALAAAAIMHRRIAAAAALADATSPAVAAAAAAELEAAHAAVGALYMRARAAAPAAASGGGSGRKGTATSRCNSGSIESSGGAAGGGVSGAGNIAAVLQELAALGDLAQSSVQAAEEAVVALTGAAREAMAARRSLETWLDGVHRIFDDLCNEAAALRMATVGNGGDDGCGDGIEANADAAGCEAVTMAAAAADAAIAAGCAAVATPLEGWLQRPGGPSSAAITVATEAATAAAAAVTRLGGAVHALREERRDGKRRRSAAAAVLEYAAAGLGRARSLAVAAECGIPDSVDGAACKNCSNSSSRSTVSLNDILARADDLIAHANAVLASAGAPVAEVSAAATAASAAANGALVAANAEVRRVQEVRAKRNAAAAAVREAEESIETTAALLRALRSRGVATSGIGDIDGTRSSADAALDPAGSAATAAASVAATSERLLGEATATLTAAKAELDLAGGGGGAVDRSARGAAEKARRATDIAQQARRCAVAEAARSFQERALARAMAPEVQAGPGSAGGVGAGSAAAAARLAGWQRQVDDAADELARQGPLLGRVASFVAEADAAIAAARGAVDGGAALDQAAAAVQRAGDAVPAGLPAEAFVAAAAVGGRRRGQTGAGGARVNGPGWSDWRG